MRPLSEITEPDPRFRALVVHDQGALRPLTLADHHAMVAGIVLPAGVTADVLTLFERARAALLYGWFAYELTPLAEHQACAALECALRQRFLAEGGALPRPPGLRRLLGAAVERGWLPEGTLDTVAPFLTELRNQVAHGDAYLGTPGWAAETLHQCATLIARLYPGEAQSTAAPLAP
ncbi:Ntn hydrolase family protein [Falsiroseomonas ponticola]|uniref:hypothetical protein n=1 Tax=Falsiroseomonas ponticola TaxID=2786951 RepID=UPI001932BF66|nr:hypothetical protein [Roseomonas ponticola]